VLRHHAQAAAGELGPGVHVRHRRIESALAKAQEAAADKRIGLMGANIDQQFLAAGDPPSLSANERSERI